MIWKRKAVDRKGGNMGGKGRRRIKSANPRRRVEPKLSTGLVCLDHLKTLEDDELSTLARARTQIEPIYFPNDT